jgi:MFS family permease
MTTRDGIAPGAWVALTLLLLINLFNFIDRQVLAAVESNIEETFFSVSEYPYIEGTRQRQDRTIEAWMGSLNLAFMVTYMLIAPLFGFLADRMSRWVLIGIGVILWTLASGASGLAGSFVVLFLTRCLVGVGEAAYGPVAPTILSDLYPVQKRGKILALFYTAIPVGSALGYVLGGKVTAWAGGDWRWAFYVVVPPGLLLGIWCFLMREPPRGQADAGAVVRNATWRDYRILWRTPSYVLVTLGMTAMTFAMGGLAFWMPRYAVERQVSELEGSLESRLMRKPTEREIAGFLARPHDEIVSEKNAGALHEHLEADLRAKLDEEREVLEKDLARQFSRTPTEEELENALVRQLITNHRTLLREDVNIKFGMIVVIAGLGATIAGGIAGDRLQPFFPGSYFLVSAVAMTLGFPLILASLWVPFPAAWYYIFAACFCLFFNTGPTNTILANVTHPSIRATGFALNILIIHALGDAISPTIIGLINGYTNMTFGFLAVSFMFLLAAVCWFIGMKHLQRDTETAPSQLGTH